MPAKSKASPEEQLGLERSRFFSDALWISPDKASGLLPPARLSVNGRVNNTCTANCSPGLPQGVWYGHE